jgi:hypothetical protein
MPSLIPFLGTAFIWFGMVPKPLGNATPHYPEGRDRNSRTDMIPPDEFYHFE